MKQPARGLGKGLSAILGELPGSEEIRKPVTYINNSPAPSPAAGTPSPSDVIRIPIDLIQPNPFQPRKAFDQEELEGLAASIKTLGLITPITVRKTEEGRYQLISGERRYRACRLAGMVEVPAYVRAADDQGMLEMAIVENIQRENLDPIEEAQSYQRLIDECNLTQEQMSERIGKKRATVANMLRLLKLPAKVQYDLKVGLISVGHAKVLLGVEDPDLQQTLCDMVINEGLNVRQLEERIKSLGKVRKPRTEKKPAESTDTQKRLCETVGAYFKKGAIIKPGANGSGTLTVHFSSEEEIGRFLDALKK